MHSDYLGPNFEDNIKLIDEEILKHKPTWNLTNISWMDWDDISQIIRLHIYKKWHLFDTNKSIKPYLNRLIDHQIRNLLRNLYGNYTRPCLKCRAADGELDCDIYQEQCNKCPLFAAWEKNRKIAYNIKSPFSLEAQDNNKEHGYTDEQDIFKSADKIHEYMHKILLENEWNIYKMLFIDNIPEKDIAIKLGYSTSEVNRIPGYKQITNLKHYFIEKVKKALKKDIIDIL